jgi:hypothetical protein
MDEAVRMERARRRFIRGVGASWRVMREHSPSLRSAHSHAISTCQNLRRAWFQLSAFSLGRSGESDVPRAADIVFPSRKQHATQRMQGDDSKCGRLDEVGHGHDANIGANIGAILSRRRAET